VDSKFLVNNTIDTVVIKGYSAIESRCFLNKTQIKFVDFDDYLLEIGYASFNGTSIEHVKFPNYFAKISNYAFGNCKQLKRIEFNEYITKIESLAFANCENLKEIYIPNNILIIGNNAFSNTSIKNVVISEYTLHNLNILLTNYSADTISFGLNKNFNFVGLSNINIVKLIQLTGTLDPNNLNVIDSLTDISNTLIENYDRVSLKIVNYNNISNLLITNNSSLKQKLFSIHLVNVLNIDDDAFKQCENLEIVELGDNLLSIRNNCFYECKLLRRIIFASTLTNIGKSAFYECNNLTTISIPNSVSFLDENTFYKCNSLQTVILPLNLEIISKAVFFGCSNLKELILPNKVRYIYPIDTFKESGLEIVYMTNSVRTNLNTNVSNIDLQFNNLQDFFDKENVRIYETNENNEISITNVNGTIKIFSLNTNIIKESDLVNENIKKQDIYMIYLPNNILEIDNNCFKDCYNLSFITFEDNNNNNSNLGLKKIGSNSFENTSINSIRFPKTLTYIGENAFKQMELHTYLSNKNSIAFDFDVNLAYTPVGGQSIIVVDKTTSDNRFEGIIEAYNSTTGKLNIKNIVNIYGDFTNTSSMTINLNCINSIVRNVLYGDTSPNVNPNFIGQLYVNTLNNELWFSKGIGNITDWIKLSN